MEPENDLVIINEEEGEYESVIPAEVPTQTEDELANLDQMSQQPTKDFKFYYTKYPYEMGCFGVFLIMTFWLIIGKGKTLALAQ